MTNLIAEVRPLVNHFFDQKNEWLINVVHDAGAPIHVVFPEIVLENLSQLRQSFLEHGLDPAIFLAHKPTISSSCLAVALENGFGVDVASLPELEHALRVGFTGEKIECTGPKSYSYLSKAVAVGARISVDSVSELKKISELGLKNNKIPSVLLRVSDPICLDRNKKSRHSRFGISRRDLKSAFDFLKESNSVRLVGLHFHVDEQDPEIKAKLTEGIVQLVQEAQAHGHPCELVNIGGGFRAPELVDFSDWSRYLDTLEFNLKKGVINETWRNYTFGMHVNERGGIGGREKVQGKFTNTALSSFVKTFLQTRMQNGQDLGNLLNDCFLKLMLEPGFAALHQAGFTAMEVIDTKVDANGDCLVVVQGNMYDISVQMKEPLVDPILVPLDREVASQTSGVYVVGNLCREEDVLIKRKVYFSQLPKSGDIVCFLNTAAYASSFESATPHMHKKPERYAAQKSERDWILVKE